MLKRIGQTFRMIANDDGTDIFQHKLRHIKVTPGLYNAFLNVHRDFESFLDKLETVIHSPEHRAMLRQGAAEGYELPDEESFLCEIRQMREQLASYDPRDRIKGAQNTFLPLAVAQGFYNTMQNVCTFLDTYCHVFNRTEYMLWLKELKLMRGTPYLGPNSLPAMCNLMLSLGVAAQQAASDHNDQKMPRNWTRAPARVHG